MKRTVTQEDSMGCGVACVAFAADITYEQALSMFDHNKARIVGFQLKEIVDALSKYGLSYYYIYVKPKKRQIVYQEGVIVFIKRSSRYPFGHYLIRHNGLWVDPWINLVTDGKLINAKSGYRKRLPGKPQWAILPVSVAR